MPNDAIWYREFMSRKILILLLALAVLIEVVFAAAVLGAPEFMLKQFSVSVSQDTLFLGYCLCWILILIAAVCAYALRLITTGQSQGHTLAYILGFWWIAIGVAIFLKWGKTDNLFLDSLKGLLIVAFNRASLARDAFK